MHKTPPQEIAILAGEFCLRSLSAKDAHADYQHWLSGDDVAEMLNLNPGLWTCQAQAALFEDYRKKPDQRLLGLFQGDRMIGIFVITLNADHGNFTFTHFIGNKADRGKGASAAATQLLLDYFFHDLGFAKAKCNVKPNNGPVVWSLHINGWIREGRLEKQMRMQAGGARSDLFAFAKFRSDLQDKLAKSI